MARLAARVSVTVAGSRSERPALLVSSSITPAGERNVRVLTPPRSCLHRCSSCGYELKRGEDSPCRFCRGAVGE